LSIFATFILFNQYGKGKKGKKICEAISANSGINSEKQQQPNFQYGYHCSCVAPQNELFFLDRFLFVTGWKASGWALPGISGLHQFGQK
jgi:hypothetical protein